MSKHTDQLNRTVSVPDQPNRIVSLVPSQTELLHYLGLEDQVVGITKFCVHPNKWYRNKVRIGGTKDPRIEKIRALRPDLLIGNKEENRREDIESLEKDYPVWLSDVQSLKDALEMIEQIGALTNRLEKAKILRKQLHQAFEIFEKENNGRAPKRAAYFIWQKPYMVVGGDTFINDMIQRAGFYNIFGDLQRYPEIGLEDLAANQPEVIFLSSEPFPFKKKHFPPFQEACPDAKIQIVDGELFSWYGSRLLHSIEYFKALRTQLW